MKILRSVAIIAVAICFVATGVLARQTATHSSGVRSGKGSHAHSHKTKGRSVASKARKNKTRQHAAELRERQAEIARRAANMERFQAGVLELPPEDLPEDDTDAEPAP